MEVGSMNGCRLDAGRVYFVAVGKRRGDDVVRLPRVSPPIISSHYVLVAGAGCLIGQDTSLAAFASEIEYFCSNTRTIYRG